MVRINIAARDIGRCWMVALPAFATIALAPVSAAAANISINDMLGRWCGASSDYTFTRTQLIVKFHNSRPNRVLTVSKVTTSESDVVVLNAWIDFDWKEGGNTVFFNFSADKREMLQDGNDLKNLPERQFHRC